MSDITFMRGYGFPRGGQMDYAGYGAYGGFLVNNRPRQLSAAQRIPFVPEPSIFEKIPALDGMADYGSEYDLTLPELDFTEGAAPVEQQPGWGPAGAASSGKKIATIAALGFGLWLVFGK